MARTAPVPNIPPIPGMNPCAWLAAGGANAGGGSGDGSGGDGDGGADGDSNKEDAEGGGKDAAGGEGCGDPVCPITGKMFLELFDFGFAAIKPLRFIRHYNSRRSDIAGAFGFGWTHPLGWRLVERRRSVEVFDDRADRQKFSPPESGGAPSFHPFGLQLSRQGDSYLLTKPDGERLTFERHPATGTCLLTSLSDQFGNATRLQYDARGALTGFTDSEGRVFVATLDPQGRITRFRVAIDAQQQNFMDLAQYRYDAAGDLVEFIDAAGFSWRYRYHHHLMVEHRTAGGLSYLYRYDGTDKNAYCVESWGEYIGADDPALLVPISQRKYDPTSLAARPKGINYVRFTYVKGTFYTEVENGIGGVTRYFGDSFGRVVKEVSPDGEVTERNFDADSGAISNQADGNGALATTAIDEYGVPTGFVRADGSAVRHTITEPFTRESFDTADGSVVVTRYDKYGQPTVVQFPDRTFEVNEYDERGLLTSYVDRSGGTTRYVWDNMGNLTEIHSANGLVERHTFDYLGRCIEFVSDAGETTTFRFDQRGEITYKRTHDGTEAHVTYDANRKVTLHQLGHRVQRFEYGGLDWLIKQTEPDGSTTEYRYDVEGRVIWVRNARGQEFHVERDNSGRTVRMEDFEGQVEEHGYDAVGRINRRVTAIGISTREYDANGQLAVLDTPDDSVALKYDGRGSNIEIASAAVKLLRQNDSLGRVVQDTQGSHELDVSWRDGSLYEISSDVGVGLRYDIAQGALNCLQAGAATLQFIFPRARESVAFLGKTLARRDVYDMQGNCVRTVFARYDRAAGLEEPQIAQTGGPDQILAVQYGYNEFGEVTQDWRSDGRVVDYTVNLMGRVTEKNLSRGSKLVSTENLRYDAVGTPLLDGVRFDARMRPIGFNGETFEYDTAGRMVRRVTDRGIWNYGWDFVGNLVRAQGPDHTVEMTYDGRGRRMGKRVSSAVDGTLLKEWSYVWTEQALLHEVDHTTGWTRTYLRKPESWHPFGHVDSLSEEEHPCYYLSDSTGMPDLAVDENGVVVWSGERTLYGDVKVDPASKVDVRARFAGQQYDEDLGLVYNRMRWYDPRIAQYLSPDPISIDGGVALRNYVPNPTFFIDPMGHGKKNPGPNASVWPPSKGPAPTPVGNHPMGKNAPKPFDKVGDMQPMGTLGPGPFATKGTKTDNNGEVIPGFLDCPKGKEKAAGSEFSKSDREAVDKAGSTYGCHGCGSKNPKGPEHPQDPASVKKALKKTHFVPDHQPPAVTHNPRNGDFKTNVPEGGVKLYPHCQRCSNIQRNQMSALKRENTEAEVKAIGQKAIKKNTAKGMKQL